MAPKIAQSFFFGKLSKTLRFPTPKDELLSYTLANQNLVQSDWNLRFFLGGDSKSLDPNLEGEQKQAYPVTGISPLDNPKCKDPKLSPKLIELSPVINQVIPNRHVGRPKTTVCGCWEVDVSPIQRVWDRNRLPAWNEPTWQLRPGDFGWIFLEDFEKYISNKHSNKRSTNTKKQHK